MSENSVKKPRVKFSVVIPLYNKEKSIKRTINSVLEQAFQDFELIVVNDGSTDDSLQVVRGINDPRIRIIDKSNGGVSSARNRGIAEAKNEWIALLDGDDLWLPNHLENLAKAIEMFPSHKVFYTGWTTDREKCFESFGSSFAFEVGNYFRFANQGKGINSSVICFHESVSKQGFCFCETLSFGEDVELWCRFAKAFLIVLVAPVSGVYRLKTENNSLKKGRDLTKTFIWHADVFRVSDNEELKFYRTMYFHELYSNLGQRNFFLLVKRYHGWALLGFLRFVFIFNWNRGKRILRRFRKQKKLK